MRTRKFQGRQQVRHFSGVSAATRPGALGPAGCAFAETAFAVLRKAMALAYPLHASTVYFPGWKFSVDVHWMYFAGGQTQGFWLAIVGECAAVVFVHRLAYLTLFGATTSGYLRGIRVSVAPAISLVLILHMSTHHTH
jgi:hypothetical protein